MHTKRFHFLLVLVFGLSCKDSDVEPEVEVELQKDCRVVTVQNFLSKTFYTYTVGGDIESRLLYYSGTGLFYKSSFEYKPSEIRLHFYNSGSNSSLLTLNGNSTVYTLNEDGNPTHVESVTSGKRELRQKIIYDGKRPSHMMVYGPSRSYIDSLVIIAWTGDNIAAIQEYFFNEEQKTFIKSPLSVTTYTFSETGLNPFYQKINYYEIDRDMSYFNKNIFSSIQWAGDPCAVQSTLNEYNFPTQLGYCGHPDVDRYTYECWAK